MSGPQESAVERLRKQAERALASAQGRRVVEPILERIVSVAPDGSEASVFAHRHLAEYRVEDHPWRALLHLRKVLSAHPDDDVVHALMGLSHALLAHFHSAVASYRRAIAAAPRNPWYHHNLGHLLDVALDLPAQALPHLQLAHRAAPEHEIAASLAHCLARLKRLDEAREIAAGAVRAAPRSKEHKQLLAWIDSGAPDDRATPATKARGTREASRTSHKDGHEADTSSADAEAAPRPSKKRERKGGTRAPAEKNDAVDSLLERSMREGGFSAQQLACAQRLWADYRVGRQRRAEKSSARPSVDAAAIEYAIARIHSMPGVTRASIARRYGVSARSVSERFDDIQVVLELVPADPRYAG